MKGWYPSNKEELQKLLKEFLKKNVKRKVNGILVPHAGYYYSGEIAGEAFCFLKNTPNKKAIVIGPNHYFQIRGIFSHNEEYWKTPLGKIKIRENNFKKIDISIEHSIDNQIPFLQFLNFEEVFPIMLSDLSFEEINELSRILSKEEGVFVFSSDLSHFLSYEEAIKKDKETIRAVENLDERYFLKERDSACGILPILLMITLSKLKGWKPRLVSYKNSGDLTLDKKSVVGYASFIF
ncbi:MAG: AmmeMemoRadiSam system protein B [Candidatus Pacearchaeota archaeon]